MKDVHTIARLGVCLMSILGSSVIIQNGEESSLVVEVKEKQDSDPILLELRGAVHNKRGGFFPRGEMVYFATKVDCMFLIWVS